MISHLLEMLILFLFNGARQGLSRLFPMRRPKPALPPRQDAIVLGQVIRSALEQQRSPNAAPRFVTLTLAMLKSHCYILGATGSGKTTLLLRIIETYLANKTGFVCIDLRGDLIGKILRLVAAKLTAEEITSGRVLLIDMDDDAQVVGFNPLVGEGDAHQRAGALHSILKSNSDSWGVQLDETIRCTLVALAERAEEGYSLLDMEPLLTDAAFRLPFLEGVKDAYTRSFFERYEELSAEQQRMWALAVLNKAAPFLANPAIRHLLGTPPTFSLRALLDEQPGQIILISLAVHRFHEAAYTLGGFFIAALQNVFAARVRQSEAERLPVGIVIDEFENFGSARFMEIVAENRKLRAHLVLAHQNLSQLDNRLRLCLLENCHAQFYFQCGAHDAEILSRAVYANEPRELVQATLLRQQVGECHFTLRGEPSVRLRVQPGAELAVTDDTVAMVRQAAWKRYARPRDEVERLLIERQQRLRTLTGSGEKLAPPRRRPRKTAASPQAETALPTHDADTQPEQIEVHEYAEESPKRSRRKSRPPQP